MNWAKYLDMLNQDIIPQLNIACGNIFNHNWWVQDGVPAHRTLNVKEPLLEIFQNRIIALGHDIEWLLRSPDLTPCDYFLRGHLKNKVYATPPINVDDIDF